MAEAKQKKLHWFLFSYSIPQAGHTALVSQFVSNESQMLTLPVLQAARQQSKLPEQSILTSTSYLGRMTADEFNPPPPVIPNVIEPTEAYMDGYHASVEMQKTGNTPINPFVVPDEELSQEAKDWADGLIAGCKRFGAVGKTSADL